MDGLLLLLKHNKYKNKLERSFIVYCSIAILHAAVNVISFVVSKTIFGLQQCVNLEGEMRVVIKPNLVAILAYVFSMSPIVPNRTLGWSAVVLSILSIIIDFKFLYTRSCRFYFFIVFILFFICFLFWDELSSAFLLEVGLLCLRLW